MVIPALESLTPAVVAAAPPLLFPCTWLACTRKAGIMRGDRKTRRGEFTNSQPPASDFTVINGRDCLPYAKWYGSGVPAFEPGTAPYWYFEPCENDKLVVGSPGVEIRLGR
jgi:hypothetical protein